MTTPARSMSLTVAAIVLLCVGTLRPAEAGVLEWTSSGPPGAAVNEVAVDPATPTTVYMIGHGVWKSADAGASWVRLASGQGAVSARALVLSPQNTSVILVGDWYERVLRSTDAGASWTASNQGLPEVGVLCLAFDPVTPSTVYAGLNRNGVYRSTDGGRTWAPLNNGIAAGVTVTTIAIDPTAPQRIFAGTYDGMIRTVDGGSSWTPVAGGLPADSLQTIVFDPTSPAVIYVGMEGRSVSKSTDGGTSWLPATTGLPSNLVVECLAFDPDTPSTLYLASDGQGMFKSTDNAASWSPAGNGLQSVTLNHVAAAATTPPAIYVGSHGQGVFKSTDGAASWLPANGGLNAAGATALVVDNEIAGRLWAASLGGVWRSSDGGAGWTPLNTGLPFVQVAGLARDAADRDTFYAATWRGLHKTTDGGASWTRADNDPTPRSYEAVATDPAVADRVFAGNWNGLWLSQDGGDTWTQPASAPTGQRVLSFAFDPVTPSRVYAGAWNGIFRSDDSGATWSSSLDDESIWSIAVDSSNPATVYVATYHGVFKSTDSGASWTSTSTGITAQYCWEIAVDPGTSSAVWVGTDEGVFRSADGAASWAPFPGLEEFDVKDLAFSPDRNTLYAATAGAGVASYTFTAPTCSLECSALAPERVVAGSEAYFEGGATVTGCAEAPAFEWDFGDGTAHSAEQSPGHRYAEVGSRTWSMTVRAGGVSCVRGGTIVVEQRPENLKWRIPAIAHAPGALGTTWRSDLAIVNPSDQQAWISVNFYPADGSNHFTRGILVQPHRAFVSRDVLVSTFELEPGAAAKGTLLIGSHQRLAIAARTFNQAASGTFGQYLPAVPEVGPGMEAAATGVALTRPGQLGVIPNLKKTTAFRSNLGVLNLAQGPITVAIRLYDAAGHQLGSTRTETIAYALYLQLDDVFSAFGAASAALAYATVEVTSADGAAWCYGSVVDNATGDPTTIPVLLPRTGEREIAGVAHAPGVGGTSWRTDVAAVYLGGGTAQLAPQLTSYNGGPTFTGAASVAAGGSAEWHDVVVNLFGRDPESSVKGTMKLPSMADLYLTARTYNQAATGTFGQYLPAVTAADGFGPGSTAVVPMLAKSQDFRSNLGILNLSRFAVVVEIRLFDIYSQQRGSTRSQSVRANEYYQLDDVFAVLGAPSLDAAYATVEVMTAGGRVWAYGSVVDNATGDPTTIPALVP